MQALERILPKPRKVLWLGEKHLKFHSIRLEIEEDLKGVKRHIEDWIRERGVPIVEEGEATLKVSRDFSNIRRFAERMSLELDPNVLGSQGYVLLVLADPPSMEIAGFTEQACFYGLQTLKQLCTQLHKALKAPEVLILDYPSIPVRGVVEGFYYEPWSWEDRKSIIKFLATVKMNAYIYAPKDDPYHREKWREKYPLEYMGKFKELVQVSKENFVEFIFAISPGLSVKYSNEEDLETLIRKIMEIKMIGVNWFAVFLDDIPNRLIHEDDKAKFKTLAEAQAYFLNRLYEKLKEIDPEIQLFMCPTEYRGTEPTSYLIELGEKLNRNIGIMWTGPQVCSRTISREAAGKISETLKRKLWIWDNYPVNDYARDWLNLGPIKGREKGLEEYVEALFSNPMNEAEASKVAIATIADYTWNTEDYDPKRGWDNSLNIVVGPRCAPYIKTLARLLGLSTLWPEYPEIVEELLRAVRENDITTLKRLFKSMLEVAAFLQTNLSNSKLLLEIKPYTSKLRNYAQAGLILLDALTCKEKDAAWKLLKSAWDLINLSESLSKRIGEIPQFVQTEGRTFPSVQPLKEALYLLSEKACTGRGWPFKKPLVYTNVRRWIDGRTPFNAIDGLCDTGFKWFYNLRKDDYIELDLRREEEIYKILFVQGEQNVTHDFIPLYEISVSTNGRNWRKIGEFCSSTLELSLQDIKARYVRVKSLKDYECKPYVRIFKACAWKAPRVETTASIARGCLENLFDGDLTTFVELVNVRAGDYLEIDAEREIKAMTIFQDTELQMVLGEIQAFMNNEWVTVDLIDSPYWEGEASSKKLRIVFKVNRKRVKIFEILLA
ncbi:MAG: hypothetical protein DRJ51_03215 [Thermoprotei archaeon]|nr:MAG: hypothetical protein DRJ51_03215 [Thermoprotei archaeon]